MLAAAKHHLKDSLVAHTYRRYLQPHFFQVDLEFQFLKRLRFDNSIEIGARTGSHTISLSKISNRVHAFEPSAHLFSILQSLNLKNVKAHNIALGLGDEKAWMLPLTTENDARQVSTKPGQIDKRDKPHGSAPGVAKLDDFRDEIDFYRVDFVRIDQRALEMQVLSGMQTLLQTNKPALLIELENLETSTYRDSLSFLVSLSYEPYFTSDGATLKKLDVSAQGKHELLGSQPTKLFFLQESRMPLYTAH